MSTAILSRSVLLNILLVFTGTLILCCRRITRSDDLRNTATSSGRDPNMVSTSAAVVSGNNSPRESILSWMEIMRTTLIRHNSINAANSLKPRTALLNFETTSSSPLSRFVMSCFQRGLSVSCWTDSSITCTQPYWHIHSLSASYSSYEFALNICQYPIQMITSANIQVLFEWPNQTIIKIELFIFSSFFLSLVFIDNHTIKYDIEKYTKYSSNGIKYRKLYIVLREIVRKHIV